MAILKRQADGFSDVLYPDLNLNLKSSLYSIRDNTNSVFAGRPLGTFYLNHAWKLLE